MSPRELRPGEGQTKDRFVDRVKVTSALLEAELQTTVLSAGFVGFEITWWKNIFSGAPQSSSATSFGTLGINFKARKARNKEEGQKALLASSCQM